MRPGRGSRLTQRAVTSPGNDLGEGSDLAVRLVWRQRNASYFGLYRLGQSKYEHCIDVIVCARAAPGVPARGSAFDHYAVRCARLWIQCHLGSSVSLPICGVTPSKRCSLRIGRRRAPFEGVRRRNYFKYGFRHGLGSGSGPANSRPTRYSTEMNHADERITT